MEFTMGAYKGGKIVLVLCTLGCSRECAAQINSIAVQRTRLVTCLTTTARVASVPFPSFVNRLKIRNPPLQRVLTRNQRVLPLTLVANRTREDTGAAPSLMLENFCTYTTYMYDWVELKWLNILFQAVCCSDGEHCCPQNTKCDLSQGRCISGSLSFPFLPRRDAPAQTPSNDMCPGGHSSCPSGDTCCKSNQGGYGCCPEANVNSFQYIPSL